MHLYNILLMFFDDHQPKVDEFIIRERPQVVLTPDPRKRKKIQFETVYARLRNELAHKRVNVDVVNTKTEMKNHLGELIALTKRAIELHS